MNHHRLPSKHFFAFELTPDLDVISKYGVISELPSQIVTADRQDVEVKSNATYAESRPLPRSICRLILTGKPLVESVIALQEKREEACKRWKSLTTDRTELDTKLQQELWSIDDYLARLYKTISHLYRQVAHESQLIRFDSSMTNVNHLEEADSRAEHVELMLDAFEKGKYKEQRKKWFLPNLLSR